jgi:hypothetical protein
MSTISLKTKSVFCFLEQKEHKVKRYFMSDNSVPAPRSGCATATDGKSIYVFGGKDAEKRMNDMWEFSLSDFKYHKLE